MKNKRERLGKEKGEREEKREGRKQRQRDVDPLFIEICLRKRETSRRRKRENKAGHTATLVACGWAAAVLEKVTRAFGQEL